MSVSTQVPATVNDPGVRDTLFDLLSPAQWHLLAETYDSAQFAAARVEDAYAVKMFLRGITQNPDFQQRLQLWQQQQQLQAQANSNGGAPAENEAGRLQAQV